MRVLAVIPVFNRKSLITKTLDSVARQTRPPDTVVVVDDGSTDDAADVIRAWIESHPQLNVRLISTANNGASSARNLGFNSCGQGVDLVGFLDSDDQWPDDFIERGIRAFSEDSNVVAASTDREFVRVDGSGAGRDSLVEISPNPWLWMLRKGAGVGSCTLFRSSAFLAAGGYPADIPTGHDSVIFGRIASLGRWSHLPGNPTRFTRASGGVDPLHGGHLHMHYPNHLFWWAKAVHQMWLEAPGNVRRGMAARKHLSRWWHKAAASALAAGNQDDARYCGRHAIAVYPFRAKNFLLFLKIIYRSA